MTIKLIAIAAFTCLIIGCTASPANLLDSSGYFSEGMPTLATIKSSKNGIQVYKKTIFTAEDFKPNGSPKSFYDYNLLTESAPCTLIGQSYQPGNQDMIYEANIGGATIQLQCRHKDSRTVENRLFLIGSDADCKSRTFHYESSILSGYKEIASLCANRKPTEKSLKALSAYAMSMKINLE